MRASRPIMAIILMLVALAAPGVALARASAQGLLVKVLTFDQARERSRTSPEERDAESQALRLANFANQDSITGAFAHPLPQVQSDAREAQAGPSETPERERLVPLATLQSAEEWRTPPPPAPLALPPASIAKLAPPLSGSAAIIAPPEQFPLSAQPAAFSARAPPLSI